MSDSKQVKLESSDDRVFTVPTEIAEMSITIKHMLEDIKDGGEEESEENAPIPLPNVTGKILEKVIEYCKYHHEHPDATTDEKKDEKKNG